MTFPEIVFFVIYIVLCSLPLSSLKDKRERNKEYHRNLVVTKVTFYDSPMFIIINLCYFSAVITGSDLIENMPKIKRKIHVTILSFIVLSFKR